MNKNAVDKLIHGFLYTHVYTAFFSDSAEQTLLYKQLHLSAYTVWDMYRNSCAVKMRLRKLFLIEGRSLCCFDASCLFIFLSE